MTDTPGVEISIKKLAETIQKEVGFEGEIVWDTEKPIGTPRKLTDPSRIQSVGWKHEVELEERIGMSYKWFLENM